MRSLSLRSLLPLLLVLLLFQCGSERLRRGISDARDWEEVKQLGGEVVWPPWNILRAYASRESDERVYFEWSKLILGEDADLPFLAGQQLGGTSDILASMREEVRRHPGVRLPYRDVSIGYPPLAFVLFMAPRLVTSTLGGYRVVFGVLVSLLYLLNIWLGLRLLRDWDQRPSDHLVLRRAAVATFFLGPILIERFDVLPALLCTAALLSVCRSRPVAGAVFLLLGGMTKLYPLLLLPAWAGLMVGWGGAQVRQLRVLLVAVVAGVATGGLLLWALTGQALTPLLHSVLVYGERPFHIESQVGGLALAIHGKSAVVGSYASFNSVFPGSERLAALWGGLMAVCLVGVALLAWQWARRHRELPAGARQRALTVFTIATLLLILATSKVLSPQYLIWCIPLVLLLPGRAGNVLHVAMVVTLLLTQLCYPYLYFWLRDAEPPVVALLVARNLLLLVLAFMTFRRAWAIPRV